MMKCFGAWTKANVEGKCLLVRVSLLQSAGAGAEGFRPKLKKNLDAQTDLRTAKAQHKRRPGRGVCEQQIFLSFPRWRPSAWLDKFRKVLLGQL